MGAIIKNGVVYGGSVTQQQSNWTESDTTSLSYIQNKPTLGTASSKDSTTTISDGGTDLPTAGAVYTALQNVHIDVDTTLDTTSNNPIANSAVATALNGKVDAVNGKGLSTNDYTDADQSKLSGIATGAEVNVQSNWNESDNSSDAYIQNKPTALSAFTNDSGFITNTVNNLTNYYTTSTIYTKTEVDNLISAAKNGRFEVVAILPTTDIQTNVIYLLPKTVSQTDNVYDEYINTDGTSAGWEKIGDTQIDLSNYVQKSSTAGLIKNDGTIDTNTYIQTSSTSGLVKNDGTIDTNSYATASSLSDYVAKSQTSGLIKNDGTIDTNTYATTSSLSDYVQKSQTSGLLKNDGTVDTNTYAQTSALPSVATSSVVGLVKPDGTTITVDANGVLTSTATGSAMSKTRYTITATNWSNSVDANGYYTYTITLNPELSLSYPPSTDIAGANDNTFSTDAEKEAYDLLDECNLTDTDTLVLYAKTKPTVNFYIWVEGEVAS